MSSVVSAIAISPELSLLAIGSSDGKIMIFDIDSIKFMRQGVIYLPSDIQNQEISTLLFMGTLPLLFVGTADGTCMIYSVRPLNPTE